MYICITKANKMTQAFRIEKLTNYFTPGKIVPSYAGFDKVIKFEYPSSNGWSEWLVYVQECDKNGNIKGEVRTHCTTPKNI